MDVHDLAMQEAMASATMILIQFTWNIPISIPHGLNVRTLTWQGATKMYRIETISESMFLSPGKQVSICVITVDILQFSNPSQYPKRRLIIRSREVSKPQDWYFKLSYCFEIWQAHWQYCCRSASQISERSDNSKYAASRLYEILRKDVFSDIETGPWTTLDTGTDHTMWSSPGKVTNKSELIQSSQQYCNIHSYQLKTPVYTVLRWRYWISFLCSLIVSIFQNFKFSKAIV